MANDFNDNDERPGQYIPSGGIQNISWFRRLPRKYKEPEDKPIGTSWLGTPIYSSLVFKGLTQAQITDNDLDPNTGATVSKNFELYQVILNVNQSKNIIRTSIQGRAGTVKEYISAGDYAISVQGIIAAEHRLVQPKEAVKALATFLDLKQSLEVGSTFLAMFGITKITVDNYTIDEVPGSRNTLTFKLQAWSDTEFKLEPTDVSS